MPCRRGALSKATPFRRGELSESDTGCMAACGETAGAEQKARVLVAGSLQFPDLRGNDGGAHRGKGGGNSSTGTDRECEDLEEEV